VFGVAVGVAGKTEFGVIELAARKMVAERRVNWRSAIVFGG
jgi:hypothetical protein